MGIFNHQEPGVMDEIRCDEPDYLIWKWHPAGHQLGESNRENAIRWGSSLRVREGSVAVFVYHQDNGVMQDIIEGPFDEILKTKNLPVIASVIGLAYAGGTPFQAEIYFINLAKVIQVQIGVPYFDVYDPRFLDFSVPVAVRGTITFNIRDYREFIKLHRLDSFSLDDFRRQIRDALSRYIKGVVVNLPKEKNIPVVQLETRISLLNELTTDTIKERLNENFGVNVTGVDISSIDIDKTSQGYQQLKAVTLDVANATTKAKAEVNIKNLHDMQRINAENTEAILKAQREEAQYAQHLHTQTSNFSAAQLSAQAEVAKAGAEALGQMGSNGATEMHGDGGMNPAGMMAGMAMGGAIGQTMAGLMNGMSQGLNPAQGTHNLTPPPVPSVTYHIVINGQDGGSFDLQALMTMAANGQINKDTLVWKQGMAEWVKAGTVEELKGLFQDSSQVPPIPQE